MSINVGRVMEGGEIGHASSAFFSPSHRPCRFGEFLWPLGIQGAIHQRARPKPCNGFPPCQLYHQSEAGMEHTQSAQRTQTMSQSPKLAKLSVINPARARGEPEPYRALSENSMNKRRIKVQWITCLFRNSDTAYLLTASFCSQLVGVSIL